LEFDSMLEPFLLQEKCITNDTFGPQIFNSSSKKDTSLVYSMDWCLKTGKKKSQQFWSYCEESQNNFMKFNLQVPTNMHLTENATFMKRVDGSLVLVEDKRQQVTRLWEMKNPQHTFYDSLHSLFPLEENDISYLVTLEKDEQEPVHPQQGSADIVHCAVQEVTSNYKNKLPSPINFMFQINFRSRSEGWFKIRCVVYYRDRKLADILSDTFMLNNPRMKKFKEHKLYTPKELKFMQIYSLSANDYPEEYWTQIRKTLNISYELCDKATTLFPQKRRKNSLHKRKMYIGCSTPRAKQARFEYLP